MVDIYFSNQTDGKWAGAHGHLITVSVYDGLLPPTSFDVKLGENHGYRTKFDKVKYKIKSRTVIRGFDSMTKSLYNCNRGAERNIYVVESNHAMTFNISIEWPPRFPDQL